MKFVNKISRWMELNLENPLCQAEIARAEMMIAEHENQGRSTDPRSDK